MKCKRSMVVVPQLIGSARGVATKQRWLRLVFTNQKMDAFMCIQMMMNMYAQIVVQKAHRKVQRRISTKFSYKLLSYDLFQEVFKLRFISRSFNIPFTNTEKTLIACEWVSFKMYKRKTENLITL